MSSRELHFTATGRPAPQGSKVSFQSKSGGIVTKEQSKYVGPWREAIHAAATLAAEKWDWVPPAGPVTVTAHIYVDRPASNRDDLPINRRTGDIDKHFRAILDALTTALVLADDCQVFCLMGQKRWAFGRPAGADISVYELVPPYDLNLAAAAC